jgi:hypothetical protein
MEGPERFPFPVLCGHRSVVMEIWLPFVLGGFHVVPLQESFQKN